MSNLFYRLYVCSTGLWTPGWRLQLLDLHDLHVRRLGREVISHHQKETRIIIIEKFDVLNLLIGISFKIIPTHFKGTKAVVKLLLSLVEK